MNLTDEEKGILTGERGETTAKILKTIVEFGEIFDASRLVPVEAKGHLVTSFGLGLLKPTYKIMDEIIAAGLKVKEGFTVDPRPDFSDIDCNFLENLIFKKKVYSLQDKYEEQLSKVGLVGKNGFTCACYLDEVGNIPKKGEYLAWAESSAVVYANSVLGARCNRNSGMLELMCSIAGKVPYFGLLTDEGRKASWIIDVKCKTLPEAQLLGSAIGMKVMEDVPYITGLDRFLGKKITAEVQGYLKDMGAASASNGAVGLYHIENLTPEAKEQKRALIKEGAKVYVIDDKEIERVYNSYPIMWKKKDARPKLCFIGCPHLTTLQLNGWTEKLSAALQKQNRKKVAVKTVLSSAPDVLDAFKKTENYKKLKNMGVYLSGLCPLMYTSNPVAVLKPIMTNSNKLRTYSVARYYPDAKILDILSGKEKN